MNHGLVVFVEWHGTLWTAQFGKKIYRVMNIGSWPRWLRGAPPQLMNDKLPLWLRTWHENSSRVRRDIKPIRSESDFQGEQHNLICIKTDANREILRTV